MQISAYQEGTKISTEVQDWYAMHWNIRQVNEYQFPSHWLNNLTQYYSNSNLSFVADGRCPPEHYQSVLRGAECCHLSVIILNLCSYILY